MERWSSVNRAVTSLTVAKPLPRCWPGVAYIFMRFVHPIKFQKRDRVHIIDPHLTSILPMHAVRACESGVNIMPQGNQLDVTKIQQALAQRGYSPGVIDGVWGRRTEGAVRAFQTASGLLVDGIVGPKTWQALLGTVQIVKPVDDTSLVWFQEARRLVGVKETPGLGSNKLILDWADDLDIAYSGDDVPWCGLFTAHCIGSTLSKEPLPNNPLSARSWLKFGAPCQPVLGSVLVFWRGSKTGWQGHVGLYAGEEKDGVFHVLGGNQSNMVSIARLSKDRFLGARWPATAPTTGGKTLLLPKGQTILSTDEH